MIAKKRVVTGLLGGLLLAASAMAAETFFLWVGTSDASWNDPSNWKKYQAAQGTTSQVSDESGIPGTTDQVRIGSSELRITNQVSISYFKCGVSTRATVTIDGGSLTTTGMSDYNSACFKTASGLIIKNGGSATFNSYLVVGTRQTQGGFVTIYDGTLRVPGAYFHNKDNDGTTNLNTRTTIYGGGLLDVDELALNSGVLNIAGGKVVVRGRNSFTEIEEWVRQGRIIAMDGSDGWTVYVDHDFATGWITLTAAPPTTVGLCNPVMRLAVEPEQS